MQAVREVDDGFEDPRLGLKAGGELWGVQRLKGAERAAVVFVLQPGPAVFEEGGLPEAGEAGDLLVGQNSFGKAAQRVEGTGSGEAREFAKFARGKLRAVEVLAVRPGALAGEAGGRGGKGGTRRVRDL